MNASAMMAAARPPAQPADDAPHVLLVDDDRRIRDLLSRFLAGEGYRVTTAASAGDARAKLLGLHFDLLILDVMMPGETGFDLARFIRKSSTVPIIMLTARSEADARIEGLQIGADDYVAKPFEPRELVLRMGNILKRTTPPQVVALEQVAFGPYVFHIERGELRQGEEIIHLTDRERETFTGLNAAYVQRHGFPFIIAVRDHGKAGILAAFRRRIGNGTEAEFEEACRQVERIAELRLRTLLP